MHLRACAGWLGGGVVYGIPPGFVTATFPAIAKIVAAVDAHPRSWSGKLATRNTTARSEKDRLSSGSTPRFSRVQRCNE